MTVRAALRKRWKSRRWPVDYWLNHFAPRCEVRSRLLGSRGGPWPLQLASQLLPRRLRRARDPRSELAVLGGPSPRDSSHLGVAPEDSQEGQKIGRGFLESPDLPSFRSSCENSQDLPDVMNHQALRPRSLLRNCLVLGGPCPPQLASQLLPLPLARARFARRLRPAAFGGLASLAVASQLLGRVRTLHPRSPGLRRDAALLQHRLLHAMRRRLRQIARYFDEARLRVARQPSSSAILFTFSS